MKKVVALLLTVGMLLGICGCKVVCPVGTTESTQATVPQTTAPETTPPETTEAKPGIPAVEGFQVGFARMEIVPEKSVPIAGLGRTTSRMSTSVHDTLYVSCFAITDEAGETILLFSVDLQRSDAAIFNSVRKVLEEKTGIPQDHIYVVATHTHSGPDTYSSHSSIPSYKQKVVEQTLQAAYDAIADRKPATMAGSSIETENMNFVKHYKNTTADGEVKYFGDNYGKPVYDSTTAHATDVDPTMYVIHITREGGKDLVMVNWRAHPHLLTNAKSYKLSADFPGAFRASMEQKYDCYFAYFQGAAGNVNNKTRISAESRTMDYDTYGNIMAEYALEAMKTEAPITSTRIQTRQVKLDMEPNHTEDHLFVAAMKVRDVWNKGATYAEAVAAGGTDAIHSPYHASAIISKMSQKKAITSELNAVSIGDSLCFVTAPHELFDTNSMWLEENSPYATTLTFGYTNGLNGYVPSAQAWEYGCYEADCAKVMPGSGELIQETFLDMLKQLKGTN